MTTVQVFLGDGYVWHLFCCYLCLPLLRCSAVEHLEEHCCSFADPRYVSCMIWWCSTLLYVLYARWVRLFADYWLGMFFGILLVRWSVLVGITLFVSVTMIPIYVRSLLFVGIVISVPDCCSFHSPLLPAGVTTLTLFFSLLFWFLFWCADSTVMFVWFRSRLRCLVIVLCCFLLFYILHSAFDRSTVRFVPVLFCCSRCCVAFPFFVHRFRSSFTCSAVVRSLFPCSTGSFGRWWYWVYALLFPDSIRYCSLLVAVLVVRYLLISSFAFSFVTIWNIATVVLFCSVLGAFVFVVILIVRTLLMQICFVVLPLPVPRYHHTPYLPLHSYWFDSLFCLLLLITCCSCRCCSVFRCWPLLGAVGFGYGGWVPSRYSTVTGADWVPLRVLRLVRRSVDVAAFPVAFVVERVRSGYRYGLNVRFNTFVPRLIHHVTHLRLPFTVFWNRSFRLISLVVRLAFVDVPVLYPVYFHYLELPLFMQFFCAVHCPIPFVVRSLRRSFQISLRSFVVLAVGVTFCVLMPAIERCSLPPGDFVVTLFCVLRLFPWSCVFVPLPMHSTLPGICSSFAAMGTLFLKLIHCSTNYIHFRSFVICLGTFWLFCWCCDPHSVVLSRCLGGAFLFWYFGTLFDLLFKFVLLVVLYTKLGVLVRNYLFPCFLIICILFPVVLVLPVPNSYCSRFWSVRILVFNSPCSDLLFLD